MAKTSLLLRLPLAALTFALPIFAATPSVPVIPPQPVAPDGPLPELFDAKGQVDREAYLRAAQLWGVQSMDDRLGPTFEKLNPNAIDSRPTLYKQPSKACENLSFANKTNPYELGKDGCKPDNDYWSEAGQVGYVPDDPANDPGLDRIQVYAYYNYVFALSPRLDYASGKPHPDPQTRENDYKKLLGHFPQHPVAMVRSYSLLQNEALVVYREGLLGVAATQTSREGYERPYPGIQFPKHKVPTGVAITSSNEFGLVTLWNTETLKGELAVVALEGRYLPFHTWPYMSMPNQGSFSAMKLLGYVELPMATPTSVAAASNGWWGGPSQTNNKVLSQIDLAHEPTRKSLHSGELGWSMIVARKGYVVVASKYENKVAILDLGELFEYVRESYLSSKESLESTLAARKAGTFPATFEEREKLRPNVVWQAELPKPTALLAGSRVDRFRPDHHKVHVATEDGNIHIIDVSPVMALRQWEKKGKFRVMGSFYVGKNPVSMAFNRFGSSNLPLLPVVREKQIPPETLNNFFYVACRGDRKVVAAVTWGGKGEVFRTIEDSRMGDPVAVNVASRGNIVTVADFHGRKVLSFRIGRIVDRHGTVYGAGEDGKAPFEFAGELPFSGKPFLVSSVNVN